MYSNIQSLECQDSVDSRSLILTRNTNTCFPQVCYLIYISNLILLEALSLGKGYTWTKKANLGKRPDGIALGLDSMILKGKKLRAKAS